MGSSFMRGYYVIHDNDDHDFPRMGFAPMSTSGKRMVKKFDKPTKSADYNDGRDNTEDSEDSEPETIYSDNEFIN
jgi:hypothetical protein